MVRNLKTEGALSVFGFFLPLPLKNVSYALWRYRGNPKSKSVALLTLFMTAVIIFLYLKGISMIQKLLRATLARGIGVTFFVVGVLFLPNLAMYSQETRFGGFADFNYGFSLDGKNLNGLDTKGFRLGQYSFFISSQLSDRISFIGESVFEFDDGFHVDVERVLLKYEATDYLNIIAGKHHTPIGYWNTAYHHGNAIQPTIWRPYMFRFEDEGGIFPIHSLGVLLTAENLTALGLGYGFMISNGLGSNAVLDNDNYKAITASVQIKPLEGLTLQGSAYFDRLSKGVATLRTNANGEIIQLPDEMAYRIYSGTVLYFNGPFEFIGEYASVANTLESLTTNTSGMYVYAGYKFGDLVLYGRFDRLAYSPDEMYFQKNDLTSIVIGARYSLGPFTVLKLEYQNLNRQTTGISNGITAQVAFGF
jgi:hypothetical protein